MTEETVKFTITNIEEIKAEIERIGQALSVLKVAGIVLADEFEAEELKIRLANHITGMMKFGFKS